MADTTIEDVQKQDLKDKPFQERAALFESKLTELCKEYGCCPWATLQSTPEALIAVATLKDLWDSSNESEPSGNSVEK